MKRDEYGEIINDEETYIDIVDILKNNGSILIGWTDEEGTHYDILFTYKTQFYGLNIQSGIKSNDLFISIMRKGAFGFKINNQGKSLDYIAEKLFIHNEFTAKKLAELINGVIKQIKEQIK